LPGQFGECSEPSKKVEQKRNGAFAFRKNVLKMCTSTSELPYKTPGFSIEPNKGRVFEIHKCRNSAQDQYFSFSCGSKLESL